MPGIRTRLQSWTQPPVRPWRPDRIIAVDLARFGALVGMFSAHLLAGNGPEGILAIVTGFPSTLFAVLGGVSATLAAKSYLEAGRPIAACLSTAVRGLVIATIGLILGAVPLFLVMVLAYYGFALVVLAFVLWMPTWLLGILAVALSALGPQFILWARTDSAAGAIPSPSLDSPFAFLQTMVFTGFYPAITWFTYLLIGVCAGRVLTSTYAARRAAWLLAFGAFVALIAFASDLLTRNHVIAVLESDGLAAAEARALTTEQGFGTPIGSGWIAVYNAAPHTGTTADIFRTGGVAIVILCVLYLLTAHRSRPLAWPIRAIATAGSAPLTLYVAHFVGLHFVLLAVLLFSSDAAKTPWWAFGPTAAVLHALAAWVFGAYLLSTSRRGPLERFVSRVSKSVTNRLTGRTKPVSEAGDAYDPELDER